LAHNIVKLIASKCVYMSTSPQLRYYTAREYITMLIGTLFSSETCGWFRGDYGWCDQL